MKMLRGIAAVAALAGASPALAADYLVNLSGSGVSASGTISTDGTIGALGQSNVTGFNLLLNDGFSTFTLTQNNAQTLFQGSVLSASASALTFNAATSGIALFQNPVVGSGVNFLCFAGSGVICGGGGSRISISVSNFGGGIAQSGSQVVGQAVAAVPEPGTWAMMLLGFGFVGAAMRSARRRQTVTVSYA